MFRRIAAVSLVATFLLAGCGAQKAGLVTSPLPATKKVPLAAGIVANNAARLTPTVGVIRGQAAVPNAPELVSTLRVLGHHAMADSELQDDAESQGFSIFAANEKGKPFSKTGFVRRTELGWMLEGQKGGFFKKKEKDNFTLIAGTTAIVTQLNERRDRKALIKGVVDKDNVVTVTSVKGLADMGFLTNWFTKGKIIGTVTNSTTDAPLDGVKVHCVGDDGAIFDVTTDEDGEFEIKSLTPGDYFLTLSKVGYQTVKADDAETVGKRDKVVYEGELAPLPTP